MRRRGLGFAKFGVFEILSGRRYGEECWREWWMSEGGEVERRDEVMVPMSFVAVCDGRRRRGEGEEMDFNKETDGLDIDRAAKSSLLEIYLTFI